MQTLSVALLILMFGWCETNAEPVSDPVTETSLEEFPTVSADANTDTKADVKTDAKPARRKDRAKPEKHLKSKYTSDKTEEEADHRVLEPIPMGRDRIVDLETNEISSKRQDYIRVGNSEVVKVTAIPRGNVIKQLILKGWGEGETNIILFKENGDVLVIFDVVVAKQNVIRHFSDLKKSLHEVEGITIHLEGSKIIIDGEVLTPNDYGKVVNVVSDPVYKDILSNRVTMSPVSLNALAKKIEADLQVIAQTVRVSVLNGKIILEGTAGSEAEKSRFAKRAEWYLPVARVSDPINKDPNIERSDKAIQIIQNDIQVVAPQPKRESKLVRLSVHFVELSKDFLKAFGFKWQPGFTSDPSISIGTSSTGEVGQSVGGFTFSGTLSSLFPALNSAQSAGYGRVLKSVTAVVKSQEEYHVKDQQQFPTTSVGANGQTGNGAPVTVGLDMKITPTIMQGQDVDINVSVSQVNVVRFASNGTPVTASHDISTRIYLKSGEVSGITSVNGQDVATAFNRDDPLPGQFSSSGGAAQTKPLWTLMRSKNYAKKRGQFVVFVSPQIIESASEGTEDMKKNYRIPSSQ